MTSTFRLHLVGVGIHPKEDITLSAITALKNASVCVTANPTDNLLEFIHQYNPRVIDIADRYANHSERSLTYHRVADSVIELLPAYPDVAYVTYGSPCMLDAPCSHLIQYCRHHNIQYTIYPGISFAEKFLSLNSCTIGNAGIQIVTAGSILRGKHAICPTQPVLISQILAIGSLTEAQILKATPDDLGNLATVLRQYYPPSHNVFLFNAALQADRLHSLEVPVAGLPLFSARVGTLTSIYVPPMMSV